MTNDELALMANIAVNMQNNEIINALKDVQSKLQELADMEWNKQVGSSKGLEDAIDVIEDYIYNLMSGGKDA